MANPPLFKEWDPALKYIEIGIKRADCTFMNLLLRYYKRYLL
jgi:hypothetical protein